MKGFDRLKGRIKKPGSKGGQAEDTAADIQALVPPATETAPQVDEEGAQLQDTTTEMEPEPSPEPVPPPKKARRLPASPIVILVVVVCIIIAAAVAAAVLLGEEEGNGSETKDDMYTEPTQWENMETIEGDISGGGPLTFIPDERAPFEVNETVYQMDIVLTWNPQDMDLDLVIEDPSGNEVVSSGNAPGEPESVRIKRNIEPGTWTAVIDPFAAANVHYSLEITYYHESGNATGPGGELLYQKTKSVTGENGDEHDEFDVGEGYDKVLIQVDISSSEGTMSMTISDSEGNEVYSGEVSGADTVSDQKTVDAKPGVWQVDYSYEEFTGTFVVQATGS
ncbi:MAG: hypothetical protein JSW28_05130 [Thermoplasmata archaeon]|nr:MAG: hypothetical protein JSW28_05130 [Thermoplasmata archaeon]